MYGAFVAIYLMLVTAATVSCQPTLFDPNHSDAVLVEAEHIHGLVTRTIWPRSYTIYPDVIKFHLHHTPESHVTLELKKNDVIEKFPIYILRDGVIFRENTEVEFGIYQNTSTGASIIIKTENDGNTMKLSGTYFHEGEEYIIQPHIKEQQSNSTTFSHVVKRQRRSLSSRQKKVLTPFDDILRTGQPLAAEEKVLGGVEEMIDKNQVNRVELLIMVDFSLYQFFYQYSGNRRIGMQHLTQYLAYTLNTMDVRYQTVTDVNIRIESAGVIIAQTARDSRWAKADRQGYMNAYNTLYAIEDLPYRIIGFPEHDHIMGMTRYDLVYNGRDVNVGLAHLGAMCTSKSVSIVEIQDFSKATVATHELGHSLFAGHDDNVTCQIDRYIMSPYYRKFLSVTTTDLPWTFSKCSIRSFVRFIRKLNRENRNCLVTKDSKFKKNWISDNQPPSNWNWYKADEQCQLKYGLRAAACRKYYRSGNYSRICLGLRCTLDGRDAGCNWQNQVIPAENTPCGNKKWCIKSFCVDDQRAPDVPDDCPLGDQQGIVHGGRTCQENFRLNPRICYDLLWLRSCCDLCRKANTGIEGCEYGDRIDNCVVGDCRFYNDTQLQDCCSTCSVFHDSTTESPITAGERFWTGPDWTTPNSSPWPVAGANVGETSQGTTEIITTESFMTLERTAFNRLTDPSPTTDQDVFTTARDDLMTASDAPVTQAPILLTTFKNTSPDRKQATFTASLERVQSTEHTRLTTQDDQPISTYSGRSTEFWFTARLWRITGGVVEREELQSTERTDRETRSPQSSTEPRISTIEPLIPTTTWFRTDAKIPTDYHVTSETTEDTYTAVSTQEALTTENIILLNDVTTPSSLVSKLSLPEVTSWGAQTEVISTSGITEGNRFQGKTAKDVYTRAPEVNTHSPVTIKDASTTKIDNPVIFKSNKTKFKKKRKKKNKNSRSSNRRRPPKCNGKKYKCRLKKQKYEWLKVFNGSWRRKRTAFGAVG